jgi:hypothetical protein
MRVAIPHQLGKDEVRRRLKSHSHEIAEHIPGGMADVTTTWPSDGRMTMQIAAMGQHLTGAIDIEAEQIIFAFDLPPALSFIEPMIEGAIRKQGQKLLAPPS